MKKSFAVLLVAIAVTFTACQKESADPTLVESINHKKLSVEMIQVGQYDLRPYVVADYEDDPEMPTILELHIGANAGNSLLYKEPWRPGNVYEIEFAQVNETSEGYLSIYFVDQYPSFNGRPDEVDIPGPLLSDRFVVYEDAGWSEFYSCSSETLNGVYRPEKDGSTIILTRMSGPGVKIYLKEL